MVNYQTVSYTDIAYNACMVPIVRNGELKGFVFNNVDELIDAFDKMFCVPEEIKTYKLSSGEHFPKSRIKEFTKKIKSVKEKPDVVIDSASNFRIQVFGVFPDQTLFAFNQALLRANERDDALKSYVESIRNICNNNVKKLFDKIVLTFLHKKDTYKHPDEQKIKELFQQPVISSYQFWKYLYSHYGKSLDNQILNSLSELVNSEDEESRQLAAMIIFNYDWSNHEVELYNMITSFLPFCNSLSSTANKFFVQMFSNHSSEHWFRRNGCLFHIDYLVNGWDKTHLKKVLVRKTVSKAFKKIQRYSNNSIIKSEDDLVKHVKDRTLVRNVSPDLIDKIYDDRDFLELYQPSLINYYDTH